MAWQLIGNLAINTLGGSIGAAVLLGLAAVWIVRIQYHTFSAMEDLGEEIKRRQRRRSDLGLQASAAVGVEEGAKARAVQHRTLSETDRDLDTIQADIARLRLALAALEQRPTWGVSPYEPVLAGALHIVRTHLLLGAGITTVLTGILCGLQVAGVLPVLFT